MKFRDEMEVFFNAEIDNKADYNQLDDCTLDDAHDSLYQMPDDVLAEMVSTDDNFDVNAFRQEFAAIHKKYGGDYSLEELLKETT